MSKLPKGSPLKLVKTAALVPGGYDLYDIRGLSLGKLMAIADAVHGLPDTAITQEISALLRNIDERQTVNGA